MIRGEIVRYRPARGSRGAEQQGMRYAVVVQADNLLGLSTILIAPTSTSAHASTFRPLITVRGTATRVLVEQIVATSTQRLGDPAGRLSSSELRDLDDALALVFGL